LSTRTQRRQATRSAVAANPLRSRFDAPWALRVAWALCFGATLLISRPLWLTDRDYPAVPVIGGLPQPPAPLDQLILIAVLAALAGTMVTPRPRRLIQGILAVTAVWLVLDQTRWQPYILTFVVAGVSLLIATAEAERRKWAMAPLQLALACTYLWSGAHKLNHTYVTAEFAQTASPLFRWTGFDPAGAASTVAAMALGTALAEIAVGAGLLLPRTRRVAVVGAVAMHAFILLMLGPLGRGVNAVVWPWNVFTAFAAWLLFWPAAAGGGFDGARRSWWRGVRQRSLAFAPRPVVIAWYAILVCFGLAPALSFAERWDASLSFQLYAGKQRQATIGYAAGQGAALPPAARRSVRIDGIVDLAHWSMEELGVTPVTEPRVVRAIGRSLARRAPDAYIRVILHGPPDLLTGTRSVREWSFDGPDAVPVEARPAR